MLIVVKHRDLHPLAQLALDVEAFRRLDVFEIDAAERRLERRDDVDDLVRVGLADLDVEYVDAGKFLEQAALALHHRFARERADVAQAQNRAAVRDHGDEIAARRIARRVERIVVDRRARVRDARRVRERKIALVRERLRRRNRDLSRRRKLVVLQRVDAQLLFGHAGLLYFFFAGGRSVQTPSNTSAAIPTLSLRVGCG